MRKSLIIMTHIYLKINIADIYVCTVHNHASMCLHNGLINISHPTLRSAELKLRFKVIKIKPNIPLSQEVANSAGHLEPAVYCVPSRCSLTYPNSH